MPRMVRLSELVIDWDVYPRKEVDQSHVESILFAIESGDRLPPIVVEKSTKRIVDGVHRYMAYGRRAGGKSDAEIEVVEKRYSSERELFLDCVRLNSGHGKRLTEADRLEITHKATRLAIDMTEISGALKIPPSTLSANLTVMPPLVKKTSTLGKATKDRKSGVMDDCYEKASKCGHRALQSTIYDGLCMACHMRDGGEIVKDRHQYFTNNRVEDDTEILGSDERKINLYHAKQLRKYIDGASDADLAGEMASALWLLDKSIRSKLKQTA